MFPHLTLLLLTHISLTLALTPPSPTTATSLALTPTSTTLCATAGFPTDVAPYFSLKSYTYNNPSSTKNNLYLGSYHVFAGAAIAVLWGESELGRSPDLAYLNGTGGVAGWLQWAVEFTPDEGFLDLYLAFDPSYYNPGTGEYNGISDYDQFATPMMITGWGGYASENTGFILNDTIGLTVVSRYPPFEGWLACDWFGTSGTVQLIPWFARYWEGGDIAALGPDGVLPANCEVVYLLPEFACC